MLLELLPMLCGPLWREKARGMEKVTMQLYRANLNYPIYNVDCSYYRRKWFCQLL